MMYVHMYFFSKKIYRILDLSKSMKLQISYLWKLRNRDHIPLTFNYQRGGNIVHTYVNVQSVSGLESKIVQFRKAIFRL